MNHQFDLYLAGPMSGLPDFNHPTFHTAAAALRAAGYTVFNPADNGLPNTAAWAEHMRTDIAHLVQCRGLATLPGHMGSKGACLEVHIARQLRMAVASVNDWLLMQEENEATA